MIAALTLAGAGLLVLYRCRRDALGNRDLFLDLNRSTEAAAITAAAPPRISPVRRWLARRLLGHDFLVGDLVEIRTWPEIKATLDERGAYEGLPFMPEMSAQCGQRARVFRCMHRLFDYRKSRKMRHMDGAVLLIGSLCDGSSHGGCEAGCHTIWKSAWLRHAQADTPAPAPADSDLPDNSESREVLAFGTTEPYVCQLTQLNAASEAAPGWSPADFLRPLVSGNVTTAAFLVGWMTYLFNELQHRRGGISFPDFERATSGAEPPPAERLSAGDEVVVRTPAEIRLTLNDQLEHRGMGFEPDMLKHCGHRHCVQAEIKKVIDIVTGEMRTMRTPAYLLRDVHFSGERQLFNAQYEPLFWRSVWLRKGADHVGEPERHRGHQRGGNQSRS